MLTVVWPFRFDQADSLQDRAHHGGRGAHAICIQDGLGKLCVDFIWHRHIDCRAAIHTLVICRLPANACMELHVLATMQSWPCNSACGVKDVDMQHQLAVWGSPSTKSNPAFLLPWTAFSMSAFCQSPHHTWAWHPNVIPWGDGGRAEHATRRDLRAGLAAPLVLCSGAHRPVKELICAMFACRNVCLTRILGVSLVHMST